MYKNFIELKKSLITVEPKKIVVAAAHDEHTLEAVFSAAKEFPLHPILVGQKKMITNIINQLGFSLKGADIVDAEDSEECAVKAVQQVRDGRGDALMKGILETSVLLKAVLDKETGIRGSGKMSHLAMLESPGYHKLVSVTDAGMIPHPDLEQKADIIRNAVDFYNRLGFKCPKVAALAAAESVSDKIPETKDAAILQDICLRGELGDCQLEGPLSFDVAVSQKSAQIKGIKSDISGDADILLVPGVAAGNIFCKGLLYWGSAKMAGCVLGAKVPIILVSRGASAEEKLLSIMLCLGSEDLKNNGGSI